MDEHIKRVDDFIYEDTDSVVEKTRSDFFRTYSAALKKYRTLGEFKKFCEDNGIPDSAEICGDVDFDIFLEWGAEDD